MSLQDWCNQLEYDIRKNAQYGSRLAAVFVCPAGEQGLIERHLKSPLPCIDLVPELRVHGVPIKMAKRMRPGRFFYLLKEEKWPTK